MLSVSSGAPITFDITGEMLKTLLTDPEYGFAFGTENWYPPLGVAVIVASLC